MAGVRQNFGKPRVLNQACYRSNYSTFRVVLPRRAIMTATLRDPGWFFQIKSTVRLFFKVQNEKKFTVFLTDPYTI